MRTLLLALLLCDASVAMASQIYLSDSDAAKIWAANSDGSDARVVVSLAAGAEPRGIAVDPNGAMLYWAENGTNRIRRAPVDGGSVEDVISSGLGFPADLEIDTVAGKLYWADRDLDVIRRANLDGSAMETVISVPANGNDTAPYFLELDVARGHLYWSDFNSGVIHRALLAGSSPEEVVTGLDRVRDIGVYAGQLYWNDRDAAVVQRENLDGSGRETLFGPTGLTLPHGLALDGISGELYFTDSDGRQIFGG
jgi:DNA-binding beta-propeller fold protein YncE